MFSRGHGLLQCNTYQWTHVCAALLVSDCVVRRTRVFCEAARIIMEIFGAEFGDMSPQELAAPVNTVAVSFEEID